MKLLQRHKLLIRDANSLATTLSFQHLKPGVANRLLTMNVANPFVTIIIPTFNASKTITNAIESIVRQTFVNLEVLVVDSASTDGTVDIIEAYQKTDSRIVFVSEKDNGIYDAMNKGIKLAKGKWVYFLGGDDLLFNNEVLTGMFKSQEVSDYDVLYGNVHGTVFNGVYGAEISQRMLMEDNICHQAIFYKKSVFDDVGYFSLKYKSYADWDHNMKWYFSDRIRKRYVNLIVAEYADGGFSAKNFDFKFLRIKNLNFLEYGRKVLGIRTKLHILKTELLTALRNKDLRMILEISRRAPFILL